MRAAAPVVLALLVLAGCGGPEAGPVDPSKVVTDHKVDPSVAKSEIEKKIEQIRASNLSAEQKEKALALLGAKP